MVSKETSHEIANTILMQMGGYSKLDVMVGIKDCFVIDCGVRFKKI